MSFSNLYLEDYHTQSFPEEMTIDDYSDAELLRAALHSAQGYFQLGMFAESREALSALSQEDRLKPDVLELQILLLLEEKKWPDVIEMATVALRLYPKLAFGYVHLAYSLHELRRTEEALNLLESAPSQIFEYVEATYNRACYLACLGRKEAALEWLERAIILEPDAREWASKDPDLRSLGESSSKGPTKFKSKIAF